MPSSSNIFEQILQKFKETSLHVTCFLSNCSAVWRAISKTNIIFQDIAHQILKANETHPDHILLVVAKPLVDGVVSKIVEYGKDCGNRNLVIIMDSVNLARFLRFRKII